MIFCQKTIKIALQLLGTEEYIFFSIFLTEWYGHFNYSNLHLHTTVPIIVTCNLRHFLTSCLSPFKDIRAWKEIETT